MRKNEKKWLVALGSILIVTAVILLLCFFMQGKTTIEGFDTEETTIALTCEASDIDYPFLAYDESTHKDVKINAIFGGERLHTISLILILFYKDSSAIRDSENLNLIAMNDSFSEAGLGFNDLGLKFAKFDDGLQMNLFANFEKINYNVIKYFLLDGMSGDMTMAKVQTILEAKKFKCQQNE